MDLIFALSQHTGIRLAEIGFLLMVFSGVWLVAAQIPRLKLERVRMIVSGAALALAGVLLIVAAHWGHFN